MNKPKDDLEKLTPAQVSNRRVAEFHSELSKVLGDPEAIAEVFSRYYKGSA